MNKKEFPYKRILVIDDSEVDFFIANTLLKKHKPSVSLYYAMDVDSALDMLKSFKPDDAPDLILLDLNFDRQKKQGIDFMKEFIAMGPLHLAGTTVMVLTAFAGFKEMKNISAYFSRTAIIEKPFSVEKLMAC
jgi:CheY-like chemotaxis protein